MTTTEQKTPAVYAAWAGVCEDMARGGIGKNKRADMGNGGKYNFRGIDDVLIALSASLVAHKLGIGISFGRPSIMFRDKGNGKSERHVAVRAEFTLVSLVDGSREGPFRFVGEAADSGDKASNKAMSIAYKYFAIQTFAIPTEGVLADEEPNEPDAPAAPARTGVYRMPDNFGGELITVAAYEDIARMRSAAVAVLNDKSKRDKHEAAQMALDEADREMATRAKR